MSLELPNQTPLCDVVQENARWAVAPDRQQFAVGTEGDAGNVSRGPVDGPQQLAICRVPEFYGLVQRGCRHEIARRTTGDGANLAGVLAEHVSRLHRGDVPDPGESINA